MKQRVHRTNAFTLIELLTVIAIIALLAALLFPAIKSALLKAEVGKAQTEIAGLQTAFKSYYTEYGKWPIADTSVGNVNSNYVYIVDTNFVALLQGANNTASLTGGSGAPSTFTPVGFSLLQGNPRQIRFLEFKKVDLDDKLGFIDPWKQAFYCRFDVTYANDVDDPFTGSVINPPRKVKAGFVIWSAGPDAQYDNADTTAGPSVKNKDNVKSW